jgi:hypothetical protein
MEQRPTHRLRPTRRGAPRDAADALILNTPHRPRCIRLACRSFLCFCRPLPLLPLALTACPSTLAAATAALPAPTTPSTTTLAQGQSRPSSPSPLTRRTWPRLHAPTVRTQSAMPPTCPASSGATMSWYVCRRVAVSLCSAVSPRSAALC